MDKIFAFGAPHNWALQIKYILVAAMLACALVNVFVGPGATLLSDIRQVAGLTN